MSEELTAESNNSTEEELFFSLIITSPPSAESLGEIVSAICKILDEHLPSHYEIILMDDKPEVLAAATELANTHDQLRVFKYTGDTPVAAGWEQAHGNVLAVIDGDLTQPPTTLSDLTKALKKGSDLAMTSQYKDGKPQNGEPDLSLLAIHKKKLPELNESSKGYQLMVEILGPETIKKMSKDGQKQSGGLMSHLKNMLTHKQ